MFNGPLQQFRRRDRFAPGLGGSQQGFGATPGGTLGLEQPSMVDGYRRLARDGLDQALVLGAERLLRGTDQDQGPKQVVLGTQGGGEHGLRPALRTGCLVASVLERVLDQGRRSMADHPPNHALSDLEALDLLQRHGDAQRRLDLKLGS